MDKKGQFLSFFVNMEFIIEYYINDMEVFYERKTYQIHAGKIWWGR